MLTVLVPTDGSPNSLLAVRHVISEHQREKSLDVHLLHVQPRLSRYMARFLAPGDRMAWHLSRAQEAMAGAQALLQQAGVAHTTHWVLGDRAHEITRMAGRTGAHHIVLGSARSRSIARLLQEPLVDRLLRTTPVPVKLVAGAGVSPWERWGLPAGILGVGGLMLLALD
jgi:nucleotide-binding universal stress UspA family protein